MKRNIKNSAGFTIIELIVVITIIAVLATIVLVNVTQYIAKGRDAAAQGNLATMQVNGAAYFDTNSNYTDFTPAATTIAANTACGGSAGFSGPCQAVVGVVSGSGGYPLVVSCSGTSCTSNTTGWCAHITLKNGGATYCVDSSGAKKNGSTCSLGACS